LSSLLKEYFWCLQASNLYNEQHKVSNKDYVFLIPIIYQPRHNYNHLKENFSYLQKFRTINRLDKHCPCMRVHEKVNQTLLLPISPSIWHDRTTMSASLQFIIFQQLFDLLNFLVKEWNSNLMIGRSWQIRSISTYNINHILKTLQSYKIEWQACFIPKSSNILMNWCL